MSVEISLNTPLADALNTAIKPKIVELGWAPDGDAALAEYIILMLVNGKTQAQIAHELSSDLLSLGPDDPGAQDFAQWLFGQIDYLNSQTNGGAAQDEVIGGYQDGAVAIEQDTEMAMSTDSPELNAPTGPKSMRSGGNMRGGGREKRLFGQMNKAMDRTHDSVLHRVRGNGTERINAHSRAPPTGPRGRGNNRMMNNRAAGITAGLNQMAAGMPNMPAPPGMNGMNDMSWMMPGGGGQQEQIFTLLQQQNQMMAQLQQQLAQQNQGQGGRGNGKSLFDRVQNPRGGRRGGSHNGHRSHQQSDATNASQAATEGEDVDMAQPRRELPNPDATVCRFNLACTNKDCKFAHQSPAAPPHTTVDVTDVCTYGAACKNRKCVGRHPSPATKRAHQNEQECKFFPNCTNASCPFKHPEAPACRNGGDCTVEGCKFTHLQTMCKFNPCTNRFCPFKHAEGQRGTFQDKVWTADGSKGHVSERRFVDQNGQEETIVPGAESAHQETAAMDEGVA
ncbi:Uu.00g038110.m01.CDS01 [Anthostomella pinea]|uniref:Uu.00g038110.m01.CDS01 n=1 Tax=Anthostomella pinea TaxID=933095 RepID=A0AAI8YDU8_9PEZI|nr:Uu.00g038110.m01.CDS01 [Anthostomella pinea]